MFLDLQQLRRAWSARSQTGLAPKEFARYFREEYPTARLGCTFRPESFDSPEQACEALELLRIWGLSAVRIGIRWSRVQSHPHERLHLGNYFQVLDKALELGFELTLNVGPVKSAGWPEQFIPEAVEQVCHLQKGQGIYLEHNLATHALEYFDKLLKALVRRYPPGSFVALQPDNECFKQFGVLELTASSEYLSVLIGRINKHYPGVPILLNSSGRREVRQILNFQRLADLTNPLILGYNYYFVTDTTASLYPWCRYVDDFVRMNLDTPRLSYVGENLTYEITECQAEPWGRAQWPGSDYEAFLYALTRCGQAARTQPQDIYVVRLWGVEKLLKKQLQNELSEEQKKIIKALVELAKTAQA